MFLPNVLSDLVKLIFQKRRYVHYATLCKIQCPLLSFRIKLILLHVAPRATYLKAPVSFSIIIIATNFPTVEYILNSSWLLAFAECRPLHMLLHSFGAIVLVHFLYNLASSCFLDASSGRGPSSQTKLALPVFFPYTTSRVFCAICVPTFFNFQYIHFFMCQCHGCF